MIHYHKSPSTITHRRRSSISSTSSSSSSSSSTSSTEMRTNNVTFRLATNTGTRKGRVHKSSKEKRERRATIEKLKHLVPTVNGDVSKLELLQHVIDYIFDLQRQLNDDDDSSSIVDESTSINIGEQLANILKVSFGDASDDDSKQSTEQQLKPSSTVLISSL